MRTLAALAVVALAACTFPDVDYADGGAGGGTGGAVGSCAAPPACAAAATSCAGQVAAELAACNTACKKKPMCLVQCDAARTAERNSCVAACDSCAAPGCGGEPTDCAALVGP